MEAHWLNVFETPPIDGERYLVCDTYFGEVKILTYNGVCKCWDDEEGDDYYCELDTGEKYMELPKYEY